MDGMVDCAAPTIPYQDRLKELIGHRKAWATLSWRRSSLRIPGGMEEPNLYGFVAGVFAKLIQRRTFVTRHLATVHESNNRWIKRQLSFPAKEFVMDPTQDLVIFLEEDTRLALALNAALIRMNILLSPIGHGHIMDNAPSACTSKLCPQGTLTRLPGTLY